MKTSQLDQLITRYRKTSIATALIATGGTFVIMVFIFSAVPKESWNSAFNDIFEVLLAASPGLALLLTYYLSIKSVHPAYYVVWFLSLLANGYLLTITSYLTLQYTEHVGILPTAYYLAMTLLSLSNFIRLFGIRKLQKLHPASA